MDHRHPNKVLKQPKVIYSLEQSGKEWYGELNEVLKQIGFEQSRFEPCLYMTTRNKQLVTAAVYVDGLLIGCRYESEIIKVKKLLARFFPVTEKGSLRHYLGIVVKQEG